MRRSLYCLWMGPFWVFLGVQLVRLIEATGSVWITIGLSSVGIALGFITIFLLAGFFITHPWGEFFVALLTLLGSMIVFTLFIGAQEQTYYLATAIMIYMDCFAFTQSKKCGIKPTAKN